MTLTKEHKDQIKKDYSLHKNDTGSPDVQVAILTNRIKEITEHLKAFQKDNNSRRSLLKLVGRRRRLLDYINKTDSPRYQALIQKLGIRK